MNAVALLVLLASIAVLLCCMVMVFHCEYEDGMVGRLGLACLAIGAASRAFTIADDPWNMPHPSPASLFAWVGTAIFLSWHLRRFLKKVATKGAHWYSIKSSKRGGRDAYYLGRPGA